MIYSDNLARLPGARAADEPCSAAGLMDNSIKGQFETINPHDLHFHQDPDYGLTQLQEAAFYLDYSSLCPQNPGCGVEFNANSQHGMSSIQGPDAVYQQQANQYPINDRANYSHNQQTPLLEQLHNVWNEVQDLEHPNNGTYVKTKSNESLQSPSSDQLYQEMIFSNKDCQELFTDIDFSLGFQLPAFEQPVDTGNLSPDILDEVANLATVDNGLAYHPQDPLGRFIKTSLTGTGHIHLAQDAPLGAENGSHYYSPDYQGGLVDPGITWSDPSPKIKQAPVSLPSLPLAMYPSPNLSNHVPPNSQHLNGDNIILPPPKRLGRNGTPYKGRAKIESMDPRQFYENLPEVPNSWKPQSNSSVTFQYNEYGNLRTDERFSADHILDYLYFHPLNINENNDYDPKNGGLTLWVQTVPADAGKRYPDKKSDKCRFADCPIQGGSIRKGFFRVAFDENFRSGRPVDPYHCASFVHLFCLEKFCDFPQICQQFNVQPDQRHFAEGTNKMAITRDHREMAEVVRAFMRSAQKPNHWDYEQTLSFQLTSKHLELQPKTRQNKRAERGGNHIELHKGDLDRFVAGESLKKEQRKERTRDASGGEKRKRDALEEALEDAFKEEERPTKRTMRDS